MNARFAALVVVAAAQSALASGCFVSKCPDSNPVDGGVPTTNKDNCIELTPGQFYEGKTPVTGSAAWASGGAVTIRNGNGGTTVKADGAAGAVSYSAVPFDYEKANSEGAQAAHDYITQMRQPGIDGDGTSVNISAEGNGGHGYHLTVTLPSGFDGTIDAKDGNGDVTISPAGSAKQVTASTAVGDVSVAGVAGGVTLATDNGDIAISGLPTGGTAKTGLGDVTLALAAGANLTVKAMASRVVNVTNATYTVLVAAENRKTVTLGDYSKGELDLSTELGEVTIGGG
jgi:hypothetical protein